MICLKLILPVETRVDTVINDSIARGLLFDIVDFIVDS